MTIGEAAGRPDIEISDPYGGPDKRYVQAADEIQELCRHRRRFEDDAGNNRKF